MQLSREPPGQRPMLLPLLSTLTNPAGERLLVGLLVGVVMRLMAVAVFCTGAATKGLLLEPD